MLIKCCKICNLQKKINEFGIVKNKSGKSYYLNYCLVCNKDKLRKYRANNKLKIAEINKLYYERIKNLSEYKENRIRYCEINRNRKREYDKVYRLENKQKYQKYCKDNKEKIAAKRHEYYLRTLEQKSKYNKRYLASNRDKIYRKNTKYAKNRLRRDINFKLRCTLSKIIRLHLTKNGYSKDGKSILKYLPYTIQELKRHLESKFEPWMNWSNYGSYNIKIWNDNDCSTWRWNIDHIIPQSKLPYTSIEDENFKRCWELDNLRPLSAKQNLLKGNS